MKDFLIQTLIMFLGAVLPILFRAVNQVRGDFDLKCWLILNRTRFALAFVTVVVISSLLTLEGLEILKALEPLGIIVPLVAKSVIGFAISSFVLAKSSDK